MDTLIDLDEDKNIEVLILEHLNNLGIPKEEQSLQLNKYLAQIKTGGLNIEDLKKEIQDIKSMLWKTSKDIIWSVNLWKVEETERNKIQNAKLEEVTEWMKNVFYKFIEDKSDIYKPFQDIINLEDFTTTWHSFYLSLSSEQRETWKKAFMKTLKEIQRYHNKF